MMTNVALEERSRWARDAAVRSLRRKTRSREAKRGRENLKRALSIVAAAVFAVAVAARHAQVASLGYAVVALKEELNRLEAENQWLEAEIAKLSSPGRIETIAKRDLGMVPPVEVRYLKKDPEKVAALLRRTGDLDLAWASEIAGSRPGAVYARGSTNVPTDKLRED